MAVRCTSQWRAIDPASLAALPGQLGVFEFADASGNVIFIGRADSRSLFGLRSEIAVRAAEVADAQSLRLEITTAYHTRYLELLMVHQADHGALPRCNAPMPTLGRLSPGSPHGGVH